MLSSTTLERLLLDVERGTVEPESYSRKSLCGRYEPIATTTALALVAIWGGMLLGGWSRTPDLRAQ